jgi:hypothetical protein
MAVLMGLHAASRQLPLPSVTLVICTHCASTALALERGSCRDPALQDIAMLFQPLRPPPGPNRSALTDSSTQVLKDLVRARAAAVGLDLFACGRNRACARFCSAAHEEDAEATDAFTLPSWGESPCPGCRLQRPDFVPLFPPTHRVQEAVSWDYHDARYRRAAQQRRNSSTFVDNRYTSAPGHFISVIHFDFWCGALPHPAPCSHATAHRPRTHLWLHQLTSRHRTHY